MEEWDSWLEGSVGTGSETIYRHIPVKSWGMWVVEGARSGCSFPCMDTMRMGRKRPEGARRIAALYIAGRTSNPDPLGKKRSRLCVEPVMGSIPPRT